MQEINLLQGEQRRPLRVSNIGSAARPALGILIFFVLVAGAIYWVIVQRVSALQARIADDQATITQIDSEIASQSEAVSLAVKSQFALNNFSKLLDEHAHWSQVWEELGKYTLIGVTFNTLSATENNLMFTVSGGASSYTEVGKVLLGLQGSELFQKVKLGNTGPSTVGETQIAFQLEITVQDSLLRDE